MKNINKAPKNKKQSVFYKTSLPVESSTELFYLEYNIILKTIDAVNSFNLLYRTGRTGVKGGPSTHNQQDLYRAMLIFACAGLDYFIKQLIKTKLPQLILADKKSEAKFKDYVKSGMNKREGKDMVNTVALALIDHNPRSIFLNEYIEYLVSESLQSVEELCRISDASGLDKKTIFTTTKMNSLRDAFTVRNQIIHEMDINVSKENAGSTGYRTRRQRTSSGMELHTNTILNLMEEIFSAYKAKYEEFSIEVKKGK